MNPAANSSRLIVPAFMDKYTVWHLLSTPASWRTDWCIRREFGDPDFWSIMNSSWLRWPHSVRMYGRQNWTERGHVHSWKPPSDKSESPEWELKIYHIHLVVFGVHMCPINCLTFNRHSADKAECFLCSPSRCGTWYDVYTNSNEPGRTESQTSGLASRTPCNYLGSNVEADRGNHLFVPASVLTSQLSICLSEMPYKPKQNNDFLENI
jgi:hypothetical protein